MYFKYFIFKLIIKGMVNIRKIKILHISNFGSRLSNRLYFISIAKKLSNGFIREEHDVVNMSDRDIIRFNRYVSGKSGVNQLNELFFNTVQNYNPDLILFGHSDNIHLETLERIKSFNKNIKIAQTVGNKMIEDKIGKFIILKLTKLIIQRNLLAL